MINTLFTITLFELFLGGGGRLFEIGPLTLRMYLFAACLIVFASLVYLRLRRMDGQMLACGLVFFYLLVHVWGLIVGGVNGADSKDMLNEFQHSLYWLAAPFFAMMLQSARMVYRAALVVRWSGFILAVAYLLVLGLLAFGKISVLTVLPLLQGSGEVLVRGDNFLFYKGFLYLGLSIVFFIGIRQKHWILLTALVSVALVLTLTRGFLLATSIAVLLMLAAQGRKLVASIALLLIIVAAFAVFVYLPSQQGSEFAQSRSTSVAQRTSDFLQITNNMTPLSLIIGEGYAAEENDRQDIENTFLWAVWKFGIIGLIFWMTPICVCAYFYLRIPDRKYHRTASAFFFGTVLVYVETFTNPFLNNPIGLSFVLVALFSLRTLANLARPPRSIVPVSPAFEIRYHPGPATPI